MIDFNKYLLHECHIDKIYVDKKGIHFMFNEGIYVYSSDVKQYYLKRSCIHFIINDFQIGEEYHHTTIQQYNGCKRKELEFNKFLSLVNKYRFVIYIDFYSYFAKAIMLKGSLGEKEIDFTITDINKIDVEIYE